MKFEVVHTWDDYKQVFLHSNSIPMVVTASFIFAGIFGAQEDNCFDCFLRSLSDNRSYLYEIISNSFDSDMEYSLNSLEMSYLESVISDKAGFVAVISRKDYSVEYLPVHCHPRADCGYSERMRIKHKIRWQYLFDADRRTKSGEEIFNESSNARLLNAHTGIGKRLHRDYDDKFVPMCFIKSYVLNSSYYSYGRTQTLAGAKMSAEFEMLERYASIVPHIKPNLVGSFAELLSKNNPVVRPQRLTLNEVDEDVMNLYGFGQYTDLASYRWHQVVNLIDEKIYYLPEQVMYYDSQMVSGEKRFIYETSNGCALGGNYEEAVIYTLFELVERDAFLMHWYNRVAPPCFDITRIRNRGLLDIVKYMTNIGYEIRIMNITMETKIPAIWAAIIDRTHHGKVKCYNAAGAHLNPEKALEAVLVEIITSVGIYDEMIRRGELDKELATLKNSPELVNSMEDHVYFYALEENFEYIKHYYTNQETIDFVEYFCEWYQSDDHIISMREFVDRFVEYHSDIFVGVLESEVNQKLDLCCVKVIVPSMLTMTFGIKNQRLNKERIQKGAVVAGIRKDEIPFMQINTNPHPFP